MQTQQLTYVLQAAAKGSFSAAARELYVTQPTLSQQIKALEEELGTPLFYRQAKRVSLTPAGEAFVGYARQVVNATEAVRELMQEYRNAGRGRITVGCYWLFAFEGFVAPLYSFQQDWPGVDMTVRLGGSGSLLDELVHGEIDAALLIGSQELAKNREVWSQELSRDRIGVMVSIENPLSARKTLSAEDLAGEKIIFPEENTPLYRTLLPLFEKAGSARDVICRSSHNHLNAQMVNANFAVSFSSMKLARAFNTGGYRVIPFVPFIERSVHLAVMNHVRENPVMQRFLAYFTEGHGGTLSSFAHNISAPERV